MIIKISLKKKLPVRSGEGNNGPYEFHPYIVEFAEESSYGISMHAAVIELSKKRWNIEKLDAIVSTPTEIEANLSLDVRKVDERYFNEVSIFIREKQYMLEREY